MTTFVNLLTAGDTLDFTTAVADYKASDGWTLKYRLAPRVSGTVIDITAAASGDDYRVQVNATTTAGWATGFYSWAAFVEKGSERYSVSRGTLQIRVSSVAMPAGFDSRTHNQKALEAIEAVIERRASLDQKQYTIQGRQLVRMDPAELVMLHDRYKRLVARDNDAEKIAAGMPNPRRIHVRLERN